MSFTIENEKQNRMSFLMYKFFVNIKHLAPVLWAVNIPIVEFIHILAAFYHLPTIVFTQSFTDVYEFAKVGLHYTMN